ncbi:hypothetical protein [Streptomyces sp. Isolate_45]|uniref:hypothetical protein n=1 Tax=Streptomyces sp. Isolate_45 TaxID=2950111 RepID=UPI002481A360|nr:hypothetical protein [Streptomyces sp. Isolate_45]MDA5284056.1 hypothetical protein [Streptomyces sp. Isolate_45]
MNTAKRIAATCAAVLLSTLALGGAAHADGQGGGAVKAPYERTVKAAPGTDGVAARKVRPASKDDPHGRTVKAAPGTAHVPAGKVRPASQGGSHSETVEAAPGTDHVPGHPARD